MPEYYVTLDRRSDDKAGPIRQRIRVFAPDEIRAGDKARTALSPAGFTVTQVVKLGPAPYEKDDWRSDLSPYERLAYLLDPAINSYGYLSPEPDRLI